MWWTGHFVLTIVASVLLLAFTNYYFVFLFFIAGMAVDIDHYILYAIMNKNLNIFDSYELIKKFNKKELVDINKGKYPLIFHNIEFLAIISIVSFYFPFFLPIALGSFFHFAIDLITLKPYSFRNIFSLVYYFTKRYKELF